MGSTLSRDLVVAGAEIIVMSLRMMLMMTAADDFLPEMSDHLSGMMMMQHDYDDDDLIEAGAGVLRMPHQMIQMERNSYSRFCCPSSCRLQNPGQENSNCEVWMNGCPPTPQIYDYELDYRLHLQELNHSLGPEEIPHQNASFWLIE